jgi:hypothetical protein
MAQVLPTWLAPNKDRRLEFFIATPTDGAPLGEPRRLWRQWQKAPNGDWLPNYTHFVASTGPRFHRRPDGSPEPDHRANPKTEPPPTGRISRPRSKRIRGDLL